MLKIAFWSLQIWKSSRGGCPPDPATRLVHSVLAIMPPPPPLLPATKNRATALWPPLDKTLSWSTRYWVQEIYQLDRNQCIQFRKRSTFWTNGTCCLNPIFFHEDNGTQLEVNQKETAKSAFAVIMEVNGNYEKSRGKRCVLSNVTRGLFILGRE